MSLTVNQDNGSLGYVEPDPTRDNPGLSYGVVPPAPRDTDISYILSYDKKKGYLLLNGFAIKSFQWESHADKVFSELFANKKLLTRTVDVHSPAKADVIIRNIGMPKKLENAFFKVGSDGHRLQVTCRLTRGDVKHFNVSQKEVDDYIYDMRDKHYRLRDAGKRK